MAGPSPLEQIKTFFTRYTLQQKLALAGSAALVLVLLWVLVHFVSQVEYQTLYADLDPQEAQSWSPFWRPNCHSFIPFAIGNGAGAPAVTLESPVAIRLQLVVEAPAAGAAYVAFVVVRLPVFALVEEGVELPAAEIAGDFVTGTG